LAFFVPSPSTVAQYSCSVQSLVSTVAQHNRSVQSLVKIPKASMGSQTDPKRPSRDSKNSVLLRQNYRPGKRKTEAVCASPIQVQVQVQVQVWLWLALALANPRLLWLWLALAGSGWFWLALPSSRWLWLWLAQANSG